MITFESNSYSVDLPNPTFGNSTGSEVQLNVRRTLTGTQRTVISKSTQQKHNLTIENITIQQKIDFELVLSESSEESTTYTDKDSNEWDGWITNFPFDFVETYSRERTQECIDASNDGGPVERRYSCTVNFRGGLA